MLEHVPDFFFAAQQVECLREAYKKISHLNVTTLFIFSSTFEDDFNIFFTDFNTVVQFLFYTNCLTKEDVMKMLSAHESGEAFSISCYDVYLPCTIVQFIHTLAKMNQYDFLYNQLTNCLVTYFGYKKEFIKRLVTIAIKKNQTIIPTIHEEKILKTTRVASVENILDSCSNCITFDDEWQLPLSTK